METILKIPPNPPFPKGGTLKTFFSRQPLKAELVSPNVLAEDRRFGVPPLGGGIILKRGCVQPALPPKGGTPNGAR